MISNVKIETYSSYGKLNYDLSKSKSYITALAKKTGKIDKGLFASGLSTLKIKSDINLATKSKKRKNFYCVYPSSISVFVGYEKPKIYIAKDIRQNTCKFNMVKRHEQAHQQINISTLEYFIPKFSIYAKKIAYELEPIKVYTEKDADNATKYMLDKYNQEFEKMVDIFKNELKIENGKLDTNTNYKIEAGICK